MKKRLAVIIFAIILLVIVILFIKGRRKENLLGGDRDVHGCIGSAGYSWCEIKNKCLRIWEEPCEK